jgi:hypothetical protein
VQEWLLFTGLLNVLEVFGLWQACNACNCTVAAAVAMGTLRKAFLL